MDFELLQEKKRLSFALNRAKKIHNADGKTKLIEFIKSGKIKLWADAQTQYESNICYSFSKTKLDFLVKQPSHEKSDREAYDIVYNGVAAPDGEKTYLWHGQENTFLWRELQLVREFNNVLIPIEPPHDMPEEDRFSTHFIFHEDMNSLMLVRVRDYISSINKYSRYRYPSEIELIDAKGLKCLKSAIDELFPFAREHRSENPVGAPTKYKKDVIFEHLKSHFGGTLKNKDTKIVKAEVKKEIKNFLEGRYEDGGPSEKTISRYVNEFIKNGHN